jgi:hypothetical protein
MLATTSFLVPDLIRTAGLSGQTKKATILTKFKDSG